jgi:hypothetical protein
METLSMIGSLSAIAALLLVLASAVLFARKAAAKWRYHYGRHKPLHRGAAGRKHVA